MIDIHSHILPGLDDGARTIEDTAAMISAAKKAGVTALIATPHARENIPDAQSVQKAFEATRALAEKEGIRLYQGYEYHYRHFLDGNIENAVNFCLAESSVLLLELPNDLPLQWENTVRGIQLAGMEVIIAHPERYTGVQKDITAAERMVQLGCELQIDAESLDVGAQHASRKCAKELLDKGLVSWIASDAHNADAFDTFQAMRAKYGAKLREPSLLREIAENEEDTAAKIRSIGIKKKVLVAVMFAAIIGIAAGVITLWREFDNQAREKEMYDNLISQVITETHTPVPTEDTSTSTAFLTVPSPEPTPTYTGWHAPYAREADRNIDFDGLKEINPAIYAWITLDGTAVDYPLLHAPAKGDVTYLNYDVNMDLNEAGAIYTDGWNTGDLSDPITMIYGHNMKNGTMFASLHNFMDAKFFEENRVVKIYLPDGSMLEYEIFAAYKTGNEHIMALNDFSDRDVYASYLESIYTARDIGANFLEMPLSPDNRILTLVTCIGIDDKRFFVQAVLKDA